MKKLSSYILLFASLSLVKADQPIHCTSFKFHDNPIGLKEEVLGKWTFTVSE